MSHLPVWEEVALQGRTLSHCYQEARTRYAPEQEAYRKAAGYVKEYLPQAARDILAQAHEFLEGRMILCGTMGKPYFVGNPPRWSEIPLETRNMFSCSTAWSTGPYCFRLITLPAILYMPKRLYPNWKTGSTPVPRWRFPWIFPLPSPVLTPLRHGVLWNLESAQPEAGTLFSSFWPEPPVSLKKSIAK